jgi:hypothetical protein
MGSLGVVIQAATYSDGNRWQVYLDGVLHGVSNVITWSPQGLAWYADSSTTNSKTYTSQTQMRFKYGGAAYTGNWVSPVSFPGHPGRLDVVSPATFAWSTVGSAAWEGIPC